MTSDSDVNLANKRLPLTLSDAGFGESDRVEMHHIASTRSSLGLTFWTAATVCAGREHLFGVVPNKIGKDWMTSPPDTVATHHGDSSFAVVADRIQYKAHACMEYIHKSTAPRSFVTHAREFGDRDVSN